MFLKFSRRFSSLIEHQAVREFKSLKLDPPTKADYEVLNTSQNTSFLQLYESFVRHQKLYKGKNVRIRDVESKLKGIEISYKRILSDKLNQELTPKDLQELSHLISENFGLERVENLSRSQLIVESEEQLTKESLFLRYPRAALLTTWLVLGIPSFLLDP